MRCPFCQGTEDRVVDSRTSREGRAVRRRRECLNCNRRFTTYEYVEERPLLILKRDGSSEPYDRQKVLQAIRLPCAKRPITGTEIDEMVDRVEDRIAHSAADEIESRLIGEMVMDELRRRDYVAYVRFASVYRNFQDLDEFYEELRDLSAKRARAALNENQAELPLFDSR
ncbi:MAG: transcriptional regulator NrdR [Longimicrobiales bacterium]